MRKSFAGLVTLAREKFQEDPMSGTLFVFVNKNKTMMKSIYWDRTGYCIFAKQLERGKFYLPTHSEVVAVDMKRLRLILDGIFLRG